MSCHGLRHHPIDSMAQYASSIREILSPLLAFDTELVVSLEVLSPTFSELFEL